jgi:hypothetical protein
MGRTRHRAKERLRVKENCRMNPGLSWMRDASRRAPAYAGAIISIFASEIIDIIKVSSASLVTVLCKLPEST